MNSPLRELTDRYDLQRLLRSGPAASVFAATDSETGDEVIVKLVTTDGSPDQTMVHEPVTARIRALQELDSPCLPNVRDGGFTTTGSAFLVFDAVEVQSLAGVEKLSRPQLLEMLAELLDALDEMAKRDLHHGQLIRDNLHLSTDDPPHLILLGLNIRTLQPNPEGPAEPEHSLRQFALLTCNLLALPIGDTGVELSDDIRRELAQSTILKILLDRCLHTQGAAPEFAELARGLRLVARTTQPPGAQAGSSARGPAAAPTGAPPVGPPGAQSVAPSQERYPGAVDLEATISVAGTPAAIPPDAALDLDSTLPVTATDVGATGVVPSAPPSSMTPASLVPSSIAADHPMVEEPPLASEEPRPPELHDLTPPSLELPEFPELPPPPPLEQVTPPSVEAPTPPTIQPPEPLQPEPLPPPPRPVTPAPQPAAARPATPPPATPLSATPPLTTPAPAAIEAAAPKPEATSPVPPATPPVVAPAAAAPVARSSRKGLALAAAVLVAVVALAVWWFWQRSQNEPASNGSSTASVPSAPSEQPLNLPAPADARRPAEPPLPTLLLQASEALAAGEVDEAESLLADFGDAQEGLLTPRGCAFLQGLRLAVADAADQRDMARSRTSKALDRALAQHDFKRLSSLLETAEIRGLQERPGGSVQRSRLALEAHDSMWAEHRQRNHLGILRHASRLLRYAPGYENATDVREQAAVTLEAEAEQLASEGRYQEAVYRLDALREHWPTRPGLSELEARMDQQQLRETRIDNLLSEAVSAGARGRPSEGLDILDRIDPTPRFQRRYDQVAQQLTTRLQELDGAPPTVRLLGGDDALFYDRDQTATIELMVQDDYEIRAVQFLARQREGTGAYRAVPLRQQGDDGRYRAEIPASMHDNEVVYFYVLAEDVSGHQTSVGSSSEPMELKRKNWLRRLRDSG